MEHPEADQYSDEEIHQSWHRRHSASMLRMTTKNMIAHGIAIWPAGIFRFLHLEHGSTEQAEDEWHEFQCEMTDCYEHMSWYYQVHDALHIGPGCPFYYLPGIWWSYKRFVPDGEQAWYPSDHSALPAGPSAGPPEDWPESNDAKYTQPPEPEPVPLGPKPPPKPVTLAK